MFNIVYIHAHDLGRYCEPMGHPIPAPNLMRLARQGVLFRHAHASAPTCGPSRAALVTGQHPHCCGMLGLPSPRLGYCLNDYAQHLTAFLKGHGYDTALSGVQHVARAPFVKPEEVLAYDRFLNHTPTGRQIHDPRTTAESAVDFLHETHDAPFFLSVGFLEPHRDKEDTRIFVESVDLREPEDIDAEADFCQPMAHMPDTRVMRREAANFKRGVAWLDQNVGKVLQAVDMPELRDNTLVIFTTDHGPGFPEAKATLSERGTGVTLILRGPGGFDGGRAIDGLAQHIDLYPTICELLGVDAPAWLQGKSLLPLVRGDAEEIHDAVFTEQTYHGGPSPRPFRAVRTRRYRYIRCFKPDAQWGVDGGPGDAFLREHGYGRAPHPAEELFDLYFDPHEAHNLAGDAAHAATLADLRARLEDWMQRTDDPLCSGNVPSPPVAGA